MKYVVAAGVSIGINLRNDSMYVYNTGRASATTVSNGGSLYISNGGIANSTTVSSGGMVFVSEGGVLNSANVRNVGRVYVYAGGSTSDVIVSKGGMQVVNSRGSTLRTSVGDGGECAVFSGGCMTSTAIKSGGTMRLRGGTAIEASVVYGGEVHVSSGGWLYRSIIDTGASVYVSGHGSAYGNTMCGRGSMHVLLGGFADLTILNHSGRLFVSSGGSVSNTTVDYLSLLEVYKGGLADATHVTNSGRGCVFSGGTMNNTMVENNGRMSAVDAGSAVSTTVSAGGSLYVSGGRVNSTTVYYAGSMEVLKGSAFDTFLSGGSLWVSSGGTALRIIDHAGYMFVCSGGTAHSATLTNAGRLTVKSGGSVYNVTLSSGGSLSISGAVVNAAKVTSGIIHVWSGGTADASVLNGIAKMYVHDYASANRTTVSRGEVYVSGLASNTTLSNGSLCVVYGGVANSTNMTSDSFLYVSNGGRANYTVMNGGSLFVSNGGVASDTIDVGSGTITLLSGGRQTGRLSVTGSSTVNVSEKSIIDFDISKLTPDTGGARVNNWSSIDGKPICTLTVSAGQTAGVYRLAERAAGFDRTFTVSTDTGTELGTLSVGGTLKSGDRSYTLAKSGGFLNLTVEGGALVMETVAGKFTATGGGVFQFMSDGGGVVRTADAATTLAGTLDPSTWELATVGDFGGLGKDGLLWVEKSTGYAYMQFDMTSFAEVEDRTYCLGVLGEGYSIKGAGDFSASGIDGVVMVGPPFGDASVSLNYGLPVWAREADGTTFNGWLGALVNTWQQGDPLKGDLSDPASINANNYQYAVVGVGDFDGDGRDDVMLQNTMPKFVTQGGQAYAITGSGDVFTFLTGDKQAIIDGAPPTVCYAGCATDGWEVVGVGDFDADGRDDVLLSDGTGVAGWKMKDGQRLDNFWFGNLSAGQSIVGVADVDNDGTDDLIVAAADDSMAAWLVKNGNVTGSMVIA